MGLNVRACVAFVALVAAIAPATAGVRVQPMSYDLKPTGEATKQDLRVENTSATPSPVEIHVERREILPDGSDKRTPADDDFLVFPPQGLIPANGFQTFRIQYVGDPAITSTKLYVITVAQIPVATGEQTGTGVQIVYNIGTLAAVSPQDSSPDLSVTAVKPATDADKLEITVENHGSRYARLRDGTWTLKGANGQVAKLEGQDLRAAIANSLIEAGKTRVVTLPVPAGFPRDGATASFALDTKR